MLSLNLAPLFNARGITQPFRFLVKAGFPNHAAHLILNNTKNSIRFDHMELLCKTFNCEPNDLLTFTPGKGTTLPSGHPLFNLTHSDTPVNIQETLSAMSYKQLQQLTKTITNKTQGS